jgi:hypothetical protein
MGMFNKKKNAKINLLEMSDVERAKLIKAVRETLQVKVAQAKLWQSLTETENLTINGARIIDEVQPRGISVTDLVRGV